MWCFDPPISLEKTLVKTHSHPAAETRAPTMTESQHVQDALATLRDTLLPRLISGQLRLPEALESAQELLRS